MTKEQGLVVKTGKEIFFGCTPQQIKVMSQEIIKKNREEVWVSVESLKEQKRKLIASINGFLLGIKDEEDRLCAKKTVIKEINRFFYFSDASADGLCLEKEALEQGEK